MTEERQCRRCKKSYPLGQLGWMIATLENNEMWLLCRNCREAVRFALNGMMLLKEVNE